MSGGLSPTRRQFLASAAAALAASAAAARGARLAPLSIRVASNQGAENATLQQLIADRGYFRRLALDATLVESRTISGPMEAVLADRADLCMISAFVGLLPAIEAGKPLRLIGAAMQLPALALYSGRADVRRVRDLAGRTVGVGGLNGLLHILTLALLRRKDVDPARVTFVSVGSNAQVFEAVAAGKVDAGLSGVAALGNPAAHVVADGQLWRELPDYTYQPAYASLRALHDRPEAVARCLAAYTSLYRFLSTPGSKAAYLEARRRAAGPEALDEGAAVWKFIQEHRPYSAVPGLSPQRVAALQQLNVSVGLQHRVLPLDAVADLGPARRAARLLI